MKLKYLPLIASILGILLLYTISLLNQPIFITLDQIDEYDGKTITIDGKVIDYHTNNYNNQLITIQQFNNTLLLYLDSPIDVQNGDEIKATGKVQQYKETWELIVKQTTDIVIIQEWKHNNINLKDIALNPTHYLQQNVNVTGYIDLVFDEYFHLKDKEQTYTFFVKIPYNTNTTIYPGKLINLHAYFTYYPEQTRYLFEITSENHTITPILENMK